MHPLIQQLEELPDHWGLVAVGNDKRPYQPEWQRNPLTKAQVASEITAGRAVAIGVIAGPLSGGLLFVDHDGLGASEVLERIGIRLTDLPKSWAVTSGRDGRLQIIYQVPKAFWDQIKTTKLKSSIPNEQLELRWAGCQSVVAGAHPITGSYRWLRGRAPADLDMAEAPSLLLQQMQRKPEPAPLLRLPDPSSDIQRARDYLSRIPTSLAEDYDDWLRIGMALQSVDPHALLDDWISWSAVSGKFEPGICEAKWDTFNGTGGVGLGTLFHLSGGKSTTTLQPQQKQPGTKPAPSGGGGKLRKVEADELLSQFRKDLGDRLRYNIFLQVIELDRKPLEDIELYYLELAQAGIKVSKELACDALFKVARENVYDPVREDLESMAATVPPVSIDNLASAYLRPGDPGGTLYDAMLKVCLIGAVKRIFEPGAKHDTACVLMGPQGCGKSTFWRNLGGRYFSDALRDISSKDDLMVLHRSWIMEWAELDHLTGKRHAGQVKGFLSQQTDTFRVPYGRTTDAFPRRGIIVGSTNNDTFLADDTGNRRFHVIPIATNGAMIEVDGLLLERDAIWSAAVAAYRAKEPNHLPLEQAQAVDRENESYLVANPWLSAVEAYLVRRVSVEPLTSEEVLINAIQKPIDRQTRGDQMQVGSILKSLGWVKFREPKGRRRWLYRSV